MTIRIGSWCTGYGGLDTAVQQVFGGQLAWVSDIDPGANRIIAHHWPTVPNHGDLTTTDWAAVEPVDIVCGGYPCQPFSNAGLRKGTADERHIWPHIADALRVLRPRIAVFENVAGHLRLGFDTVLADLARLGFDAQWCLVRASEVGAPHQRQRLFILAVNSDAPGSGRQGQGVRGRAAERDGAAAHPADVGHERSRGARRWGPGPEDHGHAPAHTDSHSLRQQPVGQPWSCGTAFAELAGPDAAAGTDRRRLPGNPERDGRTHDGQPERASRLDADGRDVLGTADWGRFAAAIRRWESVTGRPAPWATDDRNRLSPAFVEWLMGLDAGHVTAVPGLSRTQQLHALGNGVVPQQAAAAIRLLAERAGIPTAVPAAA